MGNVKRMAKENYKSSLCLKGEYDAAYTDIVCYIRTSKLEDVQQEEVIADILDMIIRAQEENRPLKEVLGEDYREFCDSVIESIAPKGVSLSKLLDSLKIIMSCTFILLTIDLVFNYLPKAIGARHTVGYELTAGFVASTAIITAFAVSIVYYIGKHSFSIPRRVSKLKTAMIFAANMLLMGGLVYITSSMRKIVIASVNAWVVIAPVAVYWARSSISKYMDKRAQE